SPADDLHSLQGKWEVRNIIWALAQQAKFPMDAGLNQKGGTVSFEANKLIVNGKMVATLDNALPQSPLHKEVGFKNFRLLVFTLPDGKTIPCSYQIKGDAVEIACPHTCSCHRGSGQIVYLNRVEKVVPPRMVPVVRYAIDQEEAAGKRFKEILDERKIT